MRSRWQSEIMCRDISERTSPPFQLSSETRCPLTIDITIMACPRCQLRLSRSSKQPSFPIPRRRTFHTSPKYQRLGAFTYAQEWQTGTYYFNKAHSKTIPVAAQHTDTLLSQWATQQKRRNVADDAAYKLQLRNSIAAQRRKTDRMFISKSTAKDFGDKVVVSAFVYDGEAAAAQEEARRRNARMGVKTDREGGSKKKGPVRRRAVSGNDSTGRAMRASGGRGGATGPMRTPGAMRTGGSGASGASTGFRRIGIGSGSAAAAARGPPTR